MAHEQHTRAAPRGTYPSDLSGLLFGRLTARSVSRTDAQRRVYWRCECVCGRLVDVRRDALVRENQRSCGCFATDTRSDRQKHGSCADGRSNGDATYVTWKSMRQRCMDPNSDGYPRYGGAGVTVCDRWQDYANFLADMGARPPGMTIDRIDPWGNYEPDNCRWADWSTQNRNKRQAGGRRG